MEKMGLENQPGCPFPYDLAEDKPEKIKSPKSAWRTDIQNENEDAIKIRGLLKEYRVFARHGDIYDSFNFDKVMGRDYATLGDAFTMEVCNRFPPHFEKARIDAKSGKLIPYDEAEKFIQKGGQLQYLITGGNTAYVREMRQITNIRPALATPLLITGQLKRLSQDIVLRRSDKFTEEQINNYLKDFEHAPKEMQRKSKELESTMKEVWDELVENFLELEFVHAKDKWGLDIVDKLQLVVKISNTISSKQLDELVYMIQNQNASGRDRSFAKFALDEPDFINTNENERAHFVVYGHTHHHEVIPMDYDNVFGNKYMYFNSGTWHTYYDLARKQPKEKKFIPYKTLTYITFYRKVIEHGDQDFETWSGAYA
jgi:UDP-2,3-diacylglucosamine pyrophosphatase LpxH